MAKKSPKNGKPISSIITRIEFSDRHFRKAQFPTDMFYVKLANRILPLMTRALDGFPGKTQKLTRTVTLNIVSYLEDLVSQAGIWQAFVAICRKRYGKAIPFYDYCPEEENDIFEFPTPQGISFILWYSLNTTHPGAFINPLNAAIESLAMSLMPVLCEAYEEAPDTPGRPKLRPEAECGIPLFYQVRNLCAWVVDKCYLTNLPAPAYTNTEFVDFMQALVDKATGNSDMIDFGINSIVPFNTLAGPVGAYPQEWVAEMVACSCEPGEEAYLPILNDIKSLPYAFYGYREVGETGAVILDCDGEPMNLSSATMNGEVMPDNVKDGMSAFMSLVYFDNAWVLNGLGMPGLPPEVFADARTQRQEELKKQHDNYGQNLRNLSGSPIGVCRNLDEYLSRFPELKDKMLEDADSSMIEKLRDTDNLLYFLNSDGNVSLLPGYATCIDLPGNPYYDPENRDGISLILNHRISTPEMRRYIIDNNLIPDAGLTSAVSAEEGIRLFHDNIRFLNDYAGRDRVVFLTDK
ncbi:MAG: DUF3843 family protein [Bacteroidales bacterium]|nr:DUF3843 family protein [Bacteroidales bacterium]